MFNDACVLVKREETIYIHSISQAYSRMINNNKKNDICEEWLKDFYEFYTWCWTNYYKIGDVIIRKQKGVPFGPSNCECVTLSKMMSMRRKMQGERKNGVYLSYNGQIKTATEWSRLLGIPRTTIYDRKQHGWSDEEALSGKRTLTKRSK